MRFERLGNHQAKVPAATSIFKTLVAKSVEEMSALDFRSETISRHVKNWVPAFPFTPSRVHDN